MKIIELQEHEEASGEPGVYVIKGTKLWGFVPAHVEDRECVPYEWGRIFPEIEAFMARWPLYWRCDDLLEAWFGKAWREGAVYWSRWEPPKVVPACEPPKVVPACEHTWSDWVRVGNHVERKCSKCGEEQFDD